MCRGKFKMKTLEFTDLELLEFKRLLKMGNFK